MNDDYKDISMKHHEEINKNNRNDPLGDFIALFPFILVFIGVPIWISYMFVMSL